MSKNLECMSKRELIELITRSKKETIKYVNKYLEEEEKQDTLRIVLLKLSHEFKTPLNAIIGFSDLLKLQKNNPEDYKYLNNISNASKHLLSLIQDLLDVTRSQYKPLELSKTYFNTKDVIQNIISGFHNKNINYTLSDITIYADQTRFKQVIYNLVTNAVKFNSADGQITILTYLDKHFIFEISDCGEGIKDEDKEIIFDFFTQASNDLKKRQFGCGIGLSLCKSIVEAHGGEINVSSQVNIGSTFRFSIPLLG